MLAHSAKTQRLKILISFIFIFCHLWLPFASHTEQSSFNFVAPSSIFILSVDGDGQFSMACCYVHFWDELTRYTFASSSCATVPCMHAEDNNLWQNQAFQCSPCLQGFIVWTFEFTSSATLCTFRKHISFILAKCKINILSTFTGKPTQSDSQPGPRQATLHVVH